MVFGIDDALVGLAFIGLCRAAYSTVSSESEKGALAEKVNQVEAALKIADMRTNKGKQLKTDLAVARALLEAKNKDACWKKLDLALAAFGSS